MSRIDGIEKLGRLVLWLTLAGVLVAVPMGMAQEQRAQEQLRKALTEAQAKVAEAMKAKETKPIRLPISSVGPVMHALAVSSAEGRVWFSNVSPRSGVVCIVGVARHRDTGAKSASLATCQEVGPYASNVKMTVHFAGADLESTCKGGNGCEFSFRDEPDVQGDSAVASGT